MVRYTEKLLEKGEERKRLTKQLAVLVGAVAEDIAKSLPVGTRTYEDYEEKGIVQIGPGTKRPPNLFLQVVEINSNIGTAKFLAHVPIWGKPIPKVFVSDKEPGSHFFLDNDPRAKVYVASTEDYLRFANDLPQIAARFEKKADELSETLREAFDRLKEIASTEANTVSVRVTEPETKEIKVYAKVSGRSAE